MEERGFDHFEGRSWMGLTRADGTRMRAGAIIGKGGPAGRFVPLKDDLAPAAALPSPLPAAI